MYKLFFLQSVWVSPSRRSCSSIFTLTADWGGLPLEPCASITLTLFLLSPRPSASPRLQPLRPLLTGRLDHHPLFGCSGPITRRAPHPPDGLTTVKKTRKQRKKNEKEKYDRATDSRLRSPASVPRLPVLRPHARPSPLSPAPPPRSPPPAPVISVTAALLSPPQ